MNIVLIISWLVDRAKQNTSFLDRNERKFNVCLIFLDDRTMLYKNNKNNKINKITKINKKQQQEQEQETEQETEQEQKRQKQKQKIVCGQEYNIKWPF